MRTGGLSSRLRVGMLVFLVLVVLAVGEYFLAILVHSGNLPYMIVMNIVDAALIVYYFMHFRQLWHPEE